jgi:TonB-linked SusC/RagA family outer membrane protein
MSTKRIRLFLIIPMWLLLGFGALAQSRTVRGTVTSAADAGELPGVNVVQKNTSRGVTTDQDGNFSIEVSGADAILVFTFVGFEKLEVPVGNRSLINVSMISDEKTLSEVVVTALGIKREERSLGYAVGKVEGKELNRVVQENVLNSLAGKVSGVTINSTGGTGSSVSMVIRGANSLNSDNQPLFVIDGVPIANTLNNVSAGGNDNRADFGNAIGSLNPDDIENISILKGPSAAALYGSRAGNGVVLITTKSGASVNKMTVSVNSSTVFDQPYKFLKWQTMLGSGQFSAIPAEITGTPFSNPFGKLVEENVPGTYGAALDKGYEEVQWNSPIGPDGKPMKMPLVSHKDNVRNFVQTGITTTNGISVANNTGNYNYRLSYSNMWNRGIIPNSDLFRNTLNLNTSIKVSNSIRLSSVIDFSRNNSNNRPAGNRGANPLQWAYSVSPHIDILDMKEYWQPGQEGLQQRSQAPGVYNNPYFLAQEVNNAFVRDRIYGNVRADYQITPELSFFARYSLDKLDERRDLKVANSYTNDPRGAYALINIGNFEHNIDALATYQKQVM